MTACEPDVQDLFGPAHSKEVSFDFAATQKVLQVVAPNGEAVATEIEVWLQFYYGSAIPSWSRYEVVISTDKKLYTHFSDDPQSVSICHSEIAFDKELLGQLQMHIEQMNKEAVNGTFSNLAIMDGAGWTLIIFPEKMYIECMNHFPEDPHCIKLIGLLKGVCTTKDYPHHGFEN